MRLETLPERCMDTAWADTQRAESIAKATTESVTVGRITAVFLVIGVALRLVRYLLAFPLWGDEYQLAANLLNRDFAGLLAPLDYNQVAPVGFLWIELASTRLFGFSELSLRLFPALCSIASVFLFRRAAGRLLSGWPLALAMAVFAVAYYPIRHGAEVKPYASDLFVALGLWVLALDWQHAPRSTWRLWLLAALTPLAMAVSFTAVIIAGGLSASLFWTLWHARQPQAPHESVATQPKYRWVAWLAYNSVVAVSFLGLMRLNVAAQYDTARDEMTRCWADGFPPWRDPLELAGWLADVHTGEMFAYPAGAEHGGSTATFLCFCLGMWHMARHGPRPAAVAIVAWFALSLIAAALERYPYGSHARLSQYLAPAICLAASGGAATAIAWLRDPAWRLGWRRVALAGCALIAAVSLARDLVHPYKSACDRDHRTFARRFWKDAPGELTVCLQSDLHLAPYTGSFETAYRCYREIESPAVRAPTVTAAEQIARADGRVRCVAYHSASATRNPGILEEWLTSMFERYRLVQVERFSIPLARQGDHLADYYLQCYDVYHFEPIPRAPLSALTSRVTETPPPSGN